MLPQNKNVMHFDLRQEVHEEMTPKGRLGAAFKQAFHEAKILDRESVLGDKHIIPMFWNFARDSTACFVCKKSIGSTKSDKYLICDDYILGRKGLTTT
jgi:hypothetical protein